MHRSSSRRIASTLVLWSSLSTALLASSVAPAAAAPTFQIATSTVPAGQTLVVGALASGLTDLYGYQFTLRFDPSRVQFLSAQEGSFLARGGTTFFDGGMADNAGGTVSFVFDTLIGPVAGVSGAGELARFAFTTLRAGDAAFSFADILALDSNLATIDVQATSALASIPEPSTPGLLLLGAVTVAAARVRRSRRPTRSLI